MIGSWIISLVLAVSVLAIRAQIPNKDVELLTEREMDVTSNVPMKRAVAERPYFLNDFYGPPVSVNLIYILISRYSN